MVYQGSKSQIINWLIPELQSIIDKNNITFYWEPFVGGANVIDKIKCEKRVGSDKSITLIELLLKAQKDFDSLPLFCSREQFNSARAIYRGLSDKKMPLWEMGAYQYLASYGARGFAGGYGQDKNGRCYYKERLKNLKAQNLKDIIFICCDYDSYVPPAHSLIYCDPPYLGVKEYGYANETKFDHDKYWDWVREKSKDNFVICSEQTFPDDFIILKEKEKRRTLNHDSNKTAIEKLGCYKDGLLGLVKKENIY